MSHLRRDQTKQPVLAYSTYSCRCHLTRDVLPYQRATRTDQVKQCLEYSRSGGAVARQPGEMGNEVQPTDPERRAGGHEADAPASKKGENASSGRGTPEPATSKESVPPVPYHKLLRYVWRCLAVSGCILAPWSLCRKVWNPAYYLCCVCFKVFNPGPISLTTSAVILRKK